MTAPLTAAESFLALLDDLASAKPNAATAAVLLAHAAQTIRGLLAELDEDRRLDEMIGRVRSNVLDHVRKTYEEPQIGGTLRDGLSGQPLLQEPAGGASLSDALPVPPHSQVGPRPGERQAGDHPPCQCVLGESPWCFVHHPELADATDDEKQAALFRWARGDRPRPGQDAERGTSRSITGPGRTAAAAELGRLAAIGDSDDHAAHLASPDLSHLPPKAGPGVAMCEADSERNRDDGTYWSCNAARGHPERWHAAYGFDEDEGPRALIYKDAAWPVTSRETGLPNLAFDPFLQCGAVDGRWACNAVQGHAPLDHMTVGPVPGFTRPGVLARWASARPGAFQPPVCGEFSPSHGVTGENACGMEPGHFPAEPHIAFGPDGVEVERWPGNREPCPAHDMAMPHDVRYQGWRSCPPNCPYLRWNIEHGLTEAETPDGFIEVANDPDEISEADHAEAVAYLKAKYGSIPPSIQYVIEEGGRIRRRPLDRREANGHAPRPPGPADPGDDPDGDSTPFRELSAAGGEPE